MADKRQERMLEEVLKLPGNNACADCGANAPRWASVNLGVFLCVGCASVHRKMGTHMSRVKSVTLDTWTREQITTMRQVGNTVSNAKYLAGAGARLGPPTNADADERDSEMEKYIRRKYEQRAFCAGAGAGAGGGGEGARAQLAPTSLNRARERAKDIRGGSGAGDDEMPWVGRENRRNPELNDIVAVKPSPGRVEKALPGLPGQMGRPENGAGLGLSGAPPRMRPTPSRSSSMRNLEAASSAPGPSVGVSPFAPALGSARGQGQGQGQGSSLIDLGGTGSATLPLQMASPGAGGGVMGQQQQYGASPMANYQGGSSYGTQGGYFASSPTPSGAYPMFASGNPFNQQQQQQPYQHGDSAFLAIPQNGNGQYGASSPTMGMSPGGMYAGSPGGGMGMGGMGHVQGQNFGSPGMQTMGSMPMPGHWGGGGSGGMGGMGMSPGMGSYQGQGYMQQGQMYQGMR